MRQNPHKIRNERGEISTDTAKNKNKRILWTITCQQILQPRRNGQFYRHVQPTKTQSKRNGQFAQTNH